MKYESGWIECRMGTGETVFPSAPSVIPESGYENRVDNIRK